MSTYRTVSGDTFDLIARKTLGDEKRIREIIDENLDYADVIFFEAGVDLQIPDIEEAEEETNPGLPPWKRDDS